MRIASEHSLIESGYRQSLGFGRFVIAWGTLATFMLFGEARLAELH